ncbi:MAG: fumarylacetoacetase [Candidatus Eremiobacteraeota bacterium]|nr:fumarylacetoacetase [Candidatus Eremiobacteraeota bacterium]
MHPNDPALTSFVQVPAGSHFPIQNLPFGVFSTTDAGSPRVGVAIGEYVLDLAAIEAAGLLAAAPHGLRVFDRSSVNAFLGLGRDVWTRVRSRVSELLRADNPELRDNAALRQHALIPMAHATLHLPLEVTGYTDFFSSREHATNTGTMFRDARNALLPNWLELPVAYNGRPSSVVVSGTPVRRPSGQSKALDAARPTFGPCRKLDLELEMAFIVGEGNALGEPISVDAAERHIFGLVLMNDWSARDFQQWEAVPLGPFNSKSFATSISPWIVTLDALEPFRVAGPAQHPQPLGYLRQTGERAFDIHLEIVLKTHDAAEAATIARSNFKYLYWSMVQQLAHHTVSGCNTRPGDVMGSGTISGPDAASLGSLLELSANGSRPLALESGAQRTFLEDGDEAILSGWCEGENYRIGFGDVRGRILPAGTLA